MDAISVVVVVLSSLDQVAVADVCTVALIAARLTRGDVAVEPVVVNVEVDQFAAGTASESLRAHVSNFEVFKSAAELYSAHVTHGTIRRIAPIDYQIFDM